MVEFNGIGRPENLHDCHGHEGSSAIDFGLGYFDPCSRPSNPKKADDEGNEEADMPPSKARDAREDCKNQDRQKVEEAAPRAKAVDDRNPEGDG